ncbi:hypothetical protein [Kitasatospora griseola]
MIEFTVLGRVFVFAATPSLAGRSASSWATGDHAAGYRDEPPF